MAYRITFCPYQSRRSGEGTSDDSGNAYIFCGKTGEKCIAQRWCPEQGKFVISERAGSICKYYNK